MEQELLETIISDTDPDGNPFEYKVVADGSQVMLFEFEEGGFEIRNAGSAELYGELISNGPNSFFYKTPEKYSASNSIIYLDWSPNNSSQVEFSIRLNIKPVPVMLVHGLASNGAVWSDLKANLINQGWENDHIRTPSYDNDISFLISTGTINTEINGWIDQLKSDGLFFNKINLVGHSMGGLVSRQYVKNTGGNRIQKIITLNTPHSGSQLANFVLENSFGSGLANIIFNTIADDFSVTNGAMNSLRVNSDEILNLNASSLNGVRVHAVTSVFELCDYLVPSLNVANKANNRLRIFTGITSRFLGFAYYAAAGSCAIQNYVLPPPNDGIVQLISQEGGLGGNAVQNYSGILGTHHIRSTKNSSIVNSHIPSMLKENSSNSQFANNFSPTVLPPPTLLKNDDATESSTTSSGVQIVVDNINHLDTLYNSFFPNIEVTGTDSVSGVMIGYYFVELDTVLFDSVFSNIHTFNIPEFVDYEGELIINCIGVNGEGELDYHGFVTFVSQGNPPAPDVPVLISPMDESENVTNNQSLTWGNILFAESYELQVSTDNSFSNLVVDTSGVENSSLLIDNLLFDTEYFWRVRSSNATALSDWSTIWSFQTIIAPPSIPQLFLPVDGSDNIAIDTTLEWETNPNTDTYHIQLALDNSFANLEIDSIGLTDNKISISNLQNGTTYYWRVKAINIGGESNWAADWNFTTIVSAPDIPQLLLPLDNAAGLPTDFMVEWSEVTEAENYQLQVASDDSFSNTIYDEQGITAQQFTVNGLENDSTYFWRVKAQNIGGESDWSSIWNFTIEDIMDRVDAQFSETIKVNPNPSDWIVSIFIPNHNIGTVTMFNSIGKNVLIKNIISAQTEINVSQFPSGIYILQIEVGEKIGIKKIVIK